MSHSFLIPMRQPFPLTHHAEDYLDHHYTQWFLFSCLDDPTPVLLLPARLESAFRIQRAYRAHLLRKREAAMLAFTMAQHPRLGSASPAGVLGPDVLPLIKGLLV